jgi:hypothetical protein
MGKVFILTIPMQAEVVVVARVLRYRFFEIRLLILTNYNKCLSNNWGIFFVALRPCGQYVKKNGHTISAD